jgi:hypothetical protein
MAKLDLCSNLMKWSPYISENELGSENISAVEEYK